MRVVVSEFVTLDGVMEDPGGSEGMPGGGWAFRFDRGDDGNQFKLDELLAADAMLLGRKTYAGFAEAWPSRDDEAGFARKMNGMRKYVVSRTLQRADWNNSTIIRDNIVEEVARLKNEPGGNLLVGGSAQLVHTLIEHELVDELRLMIYPVMLGHGKRLLNASLQASRPFRFVDIRPSAEVLLARLEPVRSTGAA